MQSYVKREREIDIKDQYEIIKKSIKQLSSMVKSIKNSSKPDYYNENQ